HSAIAVYVYEYTPNPSFCQGVFVFSVKRTNRRALNWGGLVQSAQKRTARVVKIAETEKSLNVRHSAVFMCLSLTWDIKCDIITDNDEGTAPMIKNGHRIKG
ncbi:MAG: hypothetical protein J6Z29_10315, partial [Ruminococcus sp.]|nr:hypothetical protein [Ruminococcus sp.]